MSQDQRLLAEALPILQRDPRARLLLLDRKIQPDDREALDHYHQVALGKQRPTASGEAVWAFLQDAVLARDNREVPVEMG